MAVDGEELPTLDEATTALKAALDDAYAAEDRLLELLRTEGLVLEEGSAA